MGKDLKGRELGKGLFQRKNGTYEARAMVNGRNIYLSNKNLAALKRQFKRVKIETNQPFDQKYSKMSLDEWFAEWMSVYKAPHLAKTTLDSHRTKYYHTFGPKIGTMVMEDIYHVHVQKAVEQLYGEKKSYHTIRTSLGMVNQCMADAVRNNIIRVNPCEDVRIPGPKRGKRQIRYLSKKELDTLIEASKGNWYEECIYIMLHTGMRIGEVGGLKWKDVDFEKECIHVNQALKTTYNGGEKYEELGHLKTPNAYRTIPFIAKVREMFESQYKKQEALKKKMGSRYRSKESMEDLVFTTTMGSPVSRYPLAKELDKIVDDINLTECYNAKREERVPVLFKHVNPHALRHTFCSQCFERDINPKMVQQLMGHAHYSTTIDIYTHISQDKMAEELSKISRDW